MKRILKVSLRTVFLVTCFFALIAKLYHDRVSAERARVQQQTEHWRSVASLRKHLPELYVKIQNRDEPLRRSMIKWQGKLPEKKGDQDFTQCLRMVACQDEKASDSDLHAMSCVRTIEIVILTNDLSQTSRSGFEQLSKLPRLREVRFSSSPQVPSKFHAVFGLTKSTSLESIAFTDTFFSLSEHLRLFREIPTLKKIETRGYTFLREDWHNVLVQKDLADTAGYGDGR